MKKIVAILLVIFFGFLAFASYAEHQFCCSDSNWQQNMLAEFKTTPGTTTTPTDFSYPPGDFRKVCIDCVYDTKMVKCLCPDRTGRMSSVASYFDVKNCASIIANQNGELVCRN